MGLRAAAVAVALACAGFAVRAPAQVNLPPIRLPQLPTQLAAPIAQSDTSELNPVPQDAQTGLRRANAQRLIRTHRQTLEADPNGAPMLRSELVALDLSEVALARLMAEGFALIQRQRLPGLDSELFVLRVPAALSTKRAWQLLRELEPQASFDYDHLYADSSAGAQTLPADSDPQVMTAHEAGAAGMPAPLRAVRVGLIDGGVQRMHAVFQSLATTLWGCNGASVPSAHGTEVASLLVGESPPFHGAAPGAALYAADVYCGAATGGAIDVIAAALGWMSSQRVAVINISLVGPDNLVLKQIVRQMIARGHLIVAAVGNDGPSAPPLYPAAYPDVIGVTAVDAQYHVLLEAEQGPQVSFAAPGADMAAATAPDGYVSVRGTSFAAPIVAGLLAARLSEPDRDAAQRAVASLAHEAMDLGAPGRDATFGWGLVGAGVQTVPALVRARRPSSP
jgi:hypothetical protein